MEISFDKPLTGWIKVDISENNQSFSDTLSYTPEDLVYKLIEVLNLICSSEGNFILNGYSEPVIYNFIFKTNGNDLSFEISYKEKDNYICLFHHTELKDKMLLTFFRALSKMKSNITNDEYVKNWHYEFPEVKFQKLKSYLKQNKNTV